MKLVDLFGLSLDFIYKKRISYIFSIVIGIAFFYFFDLNILYYDSTFYVQKCVKDNFSSNIEDVYYIHYEGIIDEEYREFYKELYKIDGMGYCGTFVDSSTYFWEKDVDYSEYFYIDEWDVDSEFDAIVELDVYGSCVEIMNLKDINGDKLTAECKGNAFPIYIGIEYQDTLPVGTILKEPYIVGDIPEGIALEDIEYEYREFYVAGVIDNNQKLLSSNIIEEQDGVLRNLDKAIICVKNIGEYSDVSSFYYTTDNPKMIKNQIIKLAKEYNIELDVSTVKDTLDNMKYKQLNNLKYKGIMFSLVLAMILISISSTSVIMLVTKKREIGILYANGVTVRNMRIVVFITNLLCIGLSAILAFTLKSFRMNMIYADIPQYLEVYMNVRYFYVTWQMTFLVILIATISSVISMKVIKKYSIRELIDNSR